MAYSDITLKAASEFAALGIKEHTVNLQYLTHDYSPAVGTKFSAVAIPTINLSAGEFDENDNNFCNAQEVDGAVVTLDKRYKAGVTLTDVQAGETEIDILRDGTQAITNAITTAVNKYAFSTLSGATLSSDFSGSTKSAYADLFKVASDNGLDPYNCTVVLTPEYFSKLMATMDANVYGGSEAVQKGVVPSMYGFKAVETSPHLPTGVKGYIIDNSSFAVVTRLDAPAINGYDMTFVGKTDDGFAIQFRAFENLCEGRMILAGSILVGAKILNTKGVIKLV